MAYDEVSSAVSFFSGVFRELPDISWPIVDRLHIKLFDLDPCNFGRIFSEEKYAHKHDKPPSSGTVLDIDFRQHPALANGSAIEVTIEIDQGLNAEFVEAPGATALMPITVGSDDAEKILNNYKFVSSKVITFEVVWNGVKDLVPFNLCIVCSDTKNPKLKMPVIYDPKVQNDG